jgi:hypothetical protein
MNTCYEMFAMTKRNLSRRPMRVKPSKVKIMSKFHRIPVVQRAGRAVRHQGKRTLTMIAKQAVQNDLLHYLDVL